MGSLRRAPVIDPMGAVVCAADIKTVLIDGKVVKQDFRLAKDLDGPRKLVEASRDYLVGSVDPQSGSLPVRRVTAEEAAAATA